MVEKRRHFASKKQSNIGHRWEMVTPTFRTERPTFHTDDGASIASKFTIFFSEERLD